jgi:hypothetical protein
MWFKENVESMLDGNIGDFDICKMFVIKRFNSINSFALIRSNDRNASCISSKRMNGGNHFEWKLNIEGLRTIVDLVDGLLNSNEAGHQYFEGVDQNFIVEFSYNEDSAERFEKLMESV